MGTQAVLPRGPVSFQIWVEDADYEGPYVLRVYRGIEGGSKVEVAAERQVEAAGLSELVLPVDAPGTHFFYVEVYEPAPDRMAWSAPIWVDVL
jgi:hypothetical protein